MKYFIMFAIVMSNTFIINSDDSKAVPEQREVPKTLREQHDFYWRKRFCNNEKRKKITELPEHLLDACIKSGIDPKDIHVFEEDKRARNNAYVVGKNVILKKSFWNLDKEVQTWVFAHELSHVKHGDTLTSWAQEKKIVDFYMISFAIAAVTIATQIARKRLQSVPSVLAISGLYGMANLAATYAYYQGKHQRELRADDEAARAVGTQAAIAYMKEYIWLRDYGWDDETVVQRLRLLQEWLGFSTHPTYELRLQRLEKLERELSDKNR